MASFFRYTLSLFILLLTIYQVYGQSCEPFNPSVAPFFSSYIGTRNVFVQTTQAALKDKLSSLPILFSSITNINCRILLTQFLSYLYFPTCPPIQQACNEGFCSAVYSECVTNRNDYYMINLILANNPSPTNNTFCYTAAPFSSLPNDNCITVKNATRPNPIPLPNRCEPYRGRFCRGVISAPLVFIPDGLTQQGMEDKIRGLSAAYENVANPDCSIAGHNLFCHSTFMPCDSNSSLIALQSKLFPSAPINPIPLPSRAHVQLCRTFINTCTPQRPPVSLLGLIPNQPPTGFLIVDSPPLLIDGRSIPRPPVPFKELLFNIQNDYLKFVLLLGITDAPIVCESKYETADQTTYNLRLANVTIPSNNPPPLNSSAILPQATCVKFDSAQIIADTPPGRREAARSYCQGIISDTSYVYLPPGYRNLSELNDEVRKFFWTFGLFPPLADCNMAFARMVCASAFLPCSKAGIAYQVNNYPNFLATNGTDESSSVLDISFKFSVPSFPCRSLCTKVTSTCRIAFQLLATLSPGSSFVPDCFKSSSAPVIPGFPGGMKLYDANGVVVSGGQYDFPETNTTFLDSKFSLRPKTVPVGGKDLTFMEIDAKIFTKCNDETNPDTVSFLPALQQRELPIVCPYPTVNPWLPDKFGRTADNAARIAIGPLTMTCAVQCPSPIYTPSEYDDATQLFIGVLSVSFACLVFMVSTFLIFPEKREKRNVLYFLISTLLVSISLLISVWNGVEKHICINGVEPNHQGEGGTALGVFQGWLLHVSACWAVLWWAIQAVDVLIQVWTKKKITEAMRKKQRWFYHGIAWGWPLFFSFINLGTQSYGQDKGVRFVSFYKNDWATFYTIIIFTLVVGFTSMGIIIVIVVKSSRASKHSTLTSQLRVLLRPILYIVTFLFVFLIILSYKFYGATVESDVVASTRSWILCKLLKEPQYNYLSLGLSSLQNWVSICGDLPETSPSFSMFLAFHFAVGGQGIFVFFLFGTEKRIFELWYMLLTKCKIASKEGSQGGTSVGSKSGRSGYSKKTERSKQGRDNGADGAKSPRINNRDVRPSSPIPTPSNNRTNTGVELPEVISPPAPRTPVNNNFTSTAPIRESTSQYHHQHQQQTSSQDLGTMPSPMINNNNNYPKQSMSRPVGDYQYNNNYNNNVQDPRKSS